MTSGQRVATGAPGANLWGVVLAGGQGTRLESFLRQVLDTERPKQFCRIIGSRSMLQHTWDRGTRLVEADRIVTIITTGQERFLEDEARIPGRVLVQPANRETAPGLLLPLLWIGERDPEATIVVFPADHFIWEEERFLAHVRTAVAATSRHPGRLILLGVEADGPEQSYGWIAPGLPCETERGTELYRVRRFWEKPDRVTAARLFANGYLWNTFVVAGRLTAFLRTIRLVMPDILESLASAAPFLGTRHEADALKAAYRSLRPTDFSQQLLAARAEDLLVLPARGVYWSDWGDPRRILQTLKRFNRRPGWLPVYARAMAAGLESAG